jgi:hypothetical protein
MDLPSRPSAPISTSVARPLRGHSRTLAQANTVPAGHKGDVAHRHPIRSLFSVSWVSRHLAAVAVVLFAVVAMGGVFVFARPGYHPNSGAMSNIKVPSKLPAADAAGAAGWVWPDGVPGWEAGQMLGDYPLSGVQPVEIQPAQLAAARQGLDASKVRVLSTIRGNRQGALMILAAPQAQSSLPKTCLAAVLQGNVPISWQCPSDSPSLIDNVAHSHVLIAAASFTWPGTKNHPTYLAGIARGDVYRIVLVGEMSRSMVLYQRGTSWGQFSAVTPIPTRPSHLAVYGRNHRLVQTIPLNLAPGTQRVLR